jgi:hypothetical protein
MTPDDTNEGQPVMQERSMASTANSPNDPKEPSAWHFPFRLQIERKADLLAVAAFLLSISTLGWQIFNYFRGAEISLFPSDTITFLRFDQAGGYIKDDHFVRFIASMTYINDASPDYPDVVLREGISLDLAGCTLTQQWYEFGNSDISPHSDELLFTKRQPARPFTLRGGNAQSHETLFMFVGDNSPCQIKSPNDWDAFTSLLADSLRNSKSQSSSITINTSAALASGKTVSAPACRITFVPKEIEILQHEPYWITKLCSAVTDR